MEYIGDDLFSVFLTGSAGTTTISYNTAFYLWYYLLAKYYNVTLEGVELMHHIVMGTRKVTNYVLEDIPRLEDEYNNLKTSAEIYKFYVDYIEEPFMRPYENDKPTVPIMSETLRKMDFELWEYVENRLNTAENQEQDIRFLLDELYASIILSFDKYKDKPIIYKYIPILLQFTTQITTNIKATDSYKIVYNLKPFHTEILDLARNKILVDDKFNSLGFDTTYSTLFQLILADVLHMSDQVSFIFTPKKDGSYLGLISAIDQQYYIFFDQDMKLDDYYIDFFLKPIWNALNLKDKQTSNFIGIYNFSISPISWQENIFYTPAYKDPICLFKNAPSFRFIYPFDDIRQAVKDWQSSRYNCYREEFLNLISYYDRSYFVAVPKSSMLWDIKNVFQFHFPFDDIRHDVKDKHHPRFNYAELTTKIGVISDSSTRNSAVKNDKLLINDQVIVKLSEEEGKS